MNGNALNWLSLLLVYQKLDTDAAFDFFNVINTLLACNPELVGFHMDDLMLDNLLAVLSDSVDGRFSPVNEAKIKSIFSLLFLNIAEHLPPADNSAQELYTKNKAYYMRAILMNVLANRFTAIEELSTRLFLSQRQVSNIFRAEFGMSLKQYRYALQMRQAAWELNQYPERSIWTIAETAGYASPEIFSTLFKRYFHTPPTEYRKQTHIAYRTEKNNAV